MPAVKCARIYTRVAKRKGGDEMLETMVSQPLLSSDIEKVGDDGFLQNSPKKCSNQALYGTHNSLSSLNVHKPRY
jgi:hypothetical protein